VTATPAGDAPRRLYERLREAPGAEPAARAFAFAGAQGEERTWTRGALFARATEVAAGLRRAWEAAGAPDGDGAVIAAGSVVLRDIPPYSIAAGNPAAPVRQRFSAPTVERLQRIAWWDWPPEQVRAGWRWFYRPIAEFLSHFDPAGELPAGDGAARGS
jgi:hypothetical protein